MSQTSARREATYDDIVRVARELLAEGADLSLRAVASRMGVTAPALYRYVTGYQDLVDLVAFEIDKVAAASFEAAAALLPASDPAGRLALTVTEFRMWALAHRREFALVFANPVANPATGTASGTGARRDTLTLSSSGRLLAEQVRLLWEHNHFPVPALDDLEPTVRAAVLDPLMPVDVAAMAPRERGLLWAYLQGWTQIYGVVALEVFGHMDPRLVESGAMFVDVLRSYAPRLGLADDVDRLVVLVRERLAGP